MKNKSKLKNVYIIILLILVGGFFVYYFNNKGSSSFFDNQDEGDLRFAKRVVPGLRIMKIEDDSILKNVELLTLSREPGVDTLLVDDIITGVSMDYEKTLFADILLGERSSLYFTPVNSEQELYSEIKKLKSNKIMLGVSRKVMAGTGYANSTDIAVFNVKDLDKLDLGVILLQNTLELYK